MPMSAENSDGKVVLRLNVPEKVNQILVYRNQDLRTTSTLESYMTIEMPKDAEGKVQYFPTGEIKITDRYIKAGEEYSYWAEVYVVESVEYGYDENGLVDSSSMSINPKKQKHARFP